MVKQYVILLFSKKRAKLRLFSDMTKFPCNNLQIFCTMLSGSAVRVRCPGTQAFPPAEKFETKILVRGAARRAPAPRWGCKWRCGRKYYPDRSGTAPCCPVYAGKLPRPASFIPMLASRFIGDCRDGRGLGAGQCPGTPRPIGA